MHRITAELLQRYTYENLPSNVSVVWSRGGAINDPDDRTTHSVNEQLALAYCRIKNAQRGDKWGELPDHVRTMCIEILGYFSRRSPLPWSAGECSHLEAVQFWEILSHRFISRSAGVLTTAVSGTHGNTHFRRIEYPEIMHNDAIHSIRVLEGAPALDVMIGVRKSDGKLCLRPTEKVWKSDNSYKRWKKLYDSVSSPVCPHENLKVYPKQEWANIAKQEWLDTVVQKLEWFFLPNPSPRTLVWEDDADTSLFHAKVNFLMEVVSVEREIMRLRETKDVAGLEQEYKRLQQCREVAVRYPEVWLFDEPLTELELRHERRRVVLTPAHRKSLYTNQLGIFFLKCDTLMTFEEKLKLWGRYESYDYEKSVRRICSDSLEPEIIANFGNMEACEEFTRKKLLEVRERLFTY